MSYLSEAAKWYRQQLHQKKAWDQLEASLTRDQLDAFRDAYRDGPPVSNEKVDDNSWDGIRALAYKVGARWPQVVAAQWALESAWGKHVSGKNNFFGIKGHGTIKTTWEDYGYGPITIKASFKDFDSAEDCVRYLVDRWYKDYAGHKGVNRANSWSECCYLLKAEGYATDPIYAEKLITLINKHD
jgi:hypothetical protein